MMSRDIIITSINIVLIIIGPATHNSWKDENDLLINACVSDSDFLSLS